MSRKVLIESLTDIEKEVLNKELELKIEPTGYVFDKTCKFVTIYDIENEYLYIPFSYSTKYLRPERKELKTFSKEFVGVLREEQIEVKDTAIEQINKFGSTIISAFPGFGKSALGVYIAIKIKLKTLIVVNRIVLIKQWIETIQMFSPTSTVQVLNPKSIDEDVDFYIVNAINVPKVGRLFLNTVGFLIVDEIHLIMAESLSKCMFSICPRYVLGLSATPYRNDGFEPLINLFFGDRKICKKLYRKHIVYKVDTGFTPKQEILANGKVNWSSVIESQSESVERNELIINIIKFFEKRVFLVLVKRVIQGHYLVKRLKEENIDVTSLIGSQQEYDCNSRVLVGTTQKVSCGFNHTRLNTLILGSDIVSYWIQALGRVFRTKDGIPLVFDFVDNNGILLKHYKDRQKVYIEHGGEVKSFNKDFPYIKMS